jgi:hypothetical protein
VPAKFGGDRQQPFIGRRQWPSVASAGHADHVPRSGEAIDEQPPPVRSLLESHFSQASLPIADAICRQ